MLQDQVKVGVLAGSLFSALVGALLLLGLVERVLHGFLLKDMEQDIYADLKCGRD